MIQAITQIQMMRYLGMVKNITLSHSGKNQEFLKLTLNTKNEIGRKEYRRYYMPEFQVLEERNPRMTIDSDNMTANFNFNAGGNEFGNR
jgi:hypothetical protein